MRSFAQEVKNMEWKKFYITTPIYYPSDKLHIGHSYCTVATDCMARYKRLQGCDVMFLTGADEHGQKIELKAKEAGVTPQQFVDNIVEGPKGVKDLWKLMNISYDRFIRTTDDYHVEAIQKIFRKNIQMMNMTHGKMNMRMTWMIRKKIPMTGKKSGRSERTITGMQMMKISCCRKNWQKKFEAPCSEERRKQPKKIPMTISNLLICRIVTGGINFDSIYR